jgi:hypothetical protein
MMLSIESKLSPVIQKAYPALKTAFTLGSTVFAVNAMTEFHLQHIQVP